MVPFQVRLEQFFLTFPGVAGMMETAWGWPIAESIHFIGGHTAVGLHNENAGQVEARENIYWYAEKGKYGKENDSEYCYQHGNGFS